MGDLVILDVAQRELRLEMLHHHDLNAVSQTAHGEAKRCRVVQGCRGQIDGIVVGAVEDVQKVDARGGTKLTLG